MGVVYIREQGAVVRKRGGRLLIEKDDQRLAEIRLRETDGVAVFGAVQVTTQALSELLDRGIGLTLYTRTGRLKGHLVPAEPGNIHLRLAQYRAATDAGAALLLAKAVVQAKLRRAAALLSDYRDHYPAAALETAVRAQLDGVDRAEQAADQATLLGVEGAAARSYWTAFAALNRSDLAFDGRNRRPPRDPLNILLSLGYSLLLGEIRSLAEAAGLEPHLGFLHQPDHGRPSLALDLLEPFRPAVADRLALTLVNRRQIDAADFAQDLRPGRGGRLRLSPDGFKRYLHAYERLLTERRADAPRGWRAALADAVAGLAGALRSDLETGLPAQTWGPAVTPEESGPRQISDARPLRL